MKTTTLPPNPPGNTTQIAEYGHQLAKQFKARVILYNTKAIPVEVAEDEAIMWPEEEYGLSADCKEELALLKAHLHQLNFDHEVKPRVKFVNHSGIKKFIVTTIARTQNMYFVLISKPFSNGLSTFFLGNNGKNTIKSIIKTRILMPQVARTAPIKKIAFAIDLKNTESDLEAVYKLMPFAKELNAEILITKINTQKDTAPHFDGCMAHFLTEVANNPACPNVFYTNVNSDNLEIGLNWLCRHGQVDMLAMHHLQNSFFKPGYAASNNNKMVNALPVPLLVFAD